MSDYQYIDATGVIVPDTSTLVTVVETEWTDSLPNINVQNVDGSPNSSTPQGVMIASEVAARSSFLTNNAALANQINPNQSGGLFLDAVAALSGLERAADTFTIVPNVALAGVAGSPIAAGSQATTPGGDIFELQALVTLNGSGTGTGTFIALVAGPVAAPSGTWTPSAVLGWETVINPVNGIPGSATQSDEAFRLLRRNALALQSVSLPEAMISAVNILTGVIGVQFRQNVTSAPITIDTIALSANSVWMIVDGGTDAAVATALYDTLSGGCGWNGATSVVVTDPISGQVETVKFDRPTLVPLLVFVTCSQGSFIGDPDTSVVQAVLDFANNAIPNLKGFVVGQSASPFEIAAGINAECMGLYIRKVEISLVSVVNFQPVEIPMFIWQKATVISGDITVVVV